LAKNFIQPTKLLDYNCILDSQLSPQRCCRSVWIWIIVWLWWRAV